MTSRSSVAPAALRTSLPIFPSMPKMPTRILLIVYVPFPFLTPYICTGQ